MEKIEEILKIIDNEIEILETKGKEIVATSNDENYPINRGLTDEEEETLNSLKELSKNTRQKKGWKRQLK
jgi:hypothetical protein